ncbi:MAG TPA: T9SS type B sorting domain-containing protein, partial [Phaeodactylibacter sp.]|nr:T9SS type B sorting domain-containing protein [Phaeodactylibacter sp.]
YFLTGTGACPDDASTVTVIIDETPIAVIETADIINCSFPTTILDASNSTGGSNLNYTWTTTDGNIISGNDTSNPTIDEAGTYQLTVSLPNGCSATASIVADENFEEPDVNAGTNQQLVCNSNGVTLNGSSSIAGATYTWEGPGINADNMNLPNPEVTVAGTYTLTVTNPTNGCTSVDDVEVLANAGAPSFTLDPVGQLDCENTAQILTGPIGNNFGYQWLLDNNPIAGATEATYEATQGGTYSLQLTNTDNGCSATESVDVVDATNLPSATIAPADMLTCASGGTITLTATVTSTSTNLEYLWFDPNNNPIPNSNSLSIEVGQAGNYSFLVINNDNGCSGNDDETVVASNDFPTADAGDDTILDCDLNPITVGGNSSQGAGYSYLWTVLSGSGVITTPNNINLTTNQPGTYQLQVTDNTNGCTAIDAITISENTNVPVEVNYDLTPISCEGENDGALTIINVEGGTPPYNYAFNGSNYSNINTFPFLSPGNYSLQIEDALGCELEAEVTLNQPPPFLLDLGEDMTIELGEQAQIHTITSTSYDSLWWRPEATLPCDNCADPVVAPLQTTTYYASAINGDGCEDGDDITIFVEKNRHVYIPNVFTPNQDGNNDIFFINAGIDVLKIHALKIYTRWGEEVFEQRDFQPNDASLGWNGTFKGKKMNPAVFVYFAEIEFIDGRKIMYKGDVALRR